MSSDCSDAHRLASAHLAGIRLRQRRRSAPRARREGLDPLALGLVETLRLQRAPGGDESRGRIDGPSRARGRERPFPWGSRPGGDRPPGAVPGRPAFASPSRAGPGSGARAAGDRRCARGARSAISSQCRDREVALAAREALLHEPEHEGDGVVGAPQLAGQLPEGADHVGIVGYARPRPRAAAGRRSPDRPGCAAPWPRRSPDCSTR